MVYDNGWCAGATVNAIAKVIRHQLACRCKSVGNTWPEAISCNAPDNDMMLMMMYSLHFSVPICGAYLYVCETRRVSIMQLDRQLESASLHYLRHMPSSSVWWRSPYTRASGTVYPYRTRRGFWWFRVLPSILAENFVFHTNVPQNRPYRDTIVVLLL